MNVITDMECNNVIMAKSPLGNPLEANIDPSNTPNTPDTEFPARNRDAHEWTVAGSFTHHRRRWESSSLP